MQIGKLFTIALTPCLLNAIMFAKYQPQQLPIESSGCDSPFHVMHADVRHTESKGVGYNKGYTTLEAFGIYDRNPNFMPFLDLRGHLFNDGKLAGNVGVGERTLMTSINHILGLYLYYDVRQTHHSLTVNQLSPGIEILGKRMEYRINAYFPVSQAESRSYDHKFEKFQGNQMIIKSRKKYAMKGADAEVGAHITQSTRHDFYFGIGPYFFTDKPSRAWGGKSRLYWRYKDYVSLEASYSYDHLFKNVVQGTVTFSYPFGKKLHHKDKNCSRQSHDLTLSRAAFSPDRFEIPVVDTHHRSHVAKDPSTKQPITFWFVKNTSSSDGTYESPFPTLTQAQNASSPGDIIYLLPGDGTTKGMNSGIVLKDHQKLFGSATLQTVKTNVGKIHIPALTSKMPLITNQNGNVINLANENEISGINIEYTTGSGIKGLSPKTVGANIHNNVITGNVAISALEIHGFGNIDIHHNQFFNPNKLSFSAIEINALSTESIVVNITNNYISGYETGILVTPETLTPPQKTTSNKINIDSNTITEFLNQGIFITVGLPNSKYQISNNLIKDTQSSGVFRGGLVIFPTNNGNNGQYIIENNKIFTTTSTPTPCMLINSSAGIFSNTTAQFSIQNNHLLTGVNSGSFGINMNAGANQTTLCVSMSNNTIEIPAGSSTTALRVSSPGSTVNIDRFSNNILPTILFTGNVNMVEPDSCVR